MSLPASFMRRGGCALSSRLPTRRSTQSIAIAGVGTSRSSYGVWRRALPAPIISQTHCSAWHCAQRSKSACVTNAANFDVEVIQSQQAICLIYHIPGSSNCTSYLRAAEQLVDQVNDLVNEKDGADVEGTSSNKISWLKLCTVNADENRNLASAFSVERAKLPVTYFIMQGTIIDKVSGHITASRLNDILLKFLQHYQTEMNVDLLAKSQKASASGTAGPIPRATSTDLVSGASTKFLVKRIMDNLVGSERIRLPEESEQLDGLRKTIQQTKVKAHEELQALFRQLGLDTRKLSEEDMHRGYYASSEFIAMATISALEALYLARVYATIGDISRSNVEWATKSVQTQFEVLLGEPTVRRIMALVEANAVRGDLRECEALAKQDSLRLTGSLSAMGGDGAGLFLVEMKACAEAQAQHCVELRTIIDDVIDTRADGEGFPSEVVENLFARLKETMEQLRSLKKMPSSGSPSDTSRKRQSLLEARREHLQRSMLALLQVHATDPKSQAARSRLSSLLY